MESENVIEALLKRDRLVVSACLAGVTLVAAYYIVAGAGMGMTAVQMTASMRTERMVRA